MKVFAKTTMSYAGRDEEQEARQRGLTDRLSPLIAAKKASREASL